MFSRLFAILLLTSTAVTPMAARAIDMPAQYNDEFAAAFSERFVPAVNPTPFAAFLIEDAKQQSTSLKDFQGRYVLLNLWATWCSPCVREMPALDTLMTTLDPKKIAIIALDENSNGHDITERFYKEHNLTHLALYVDPTGRAPALTKAKGLPTTILLDPQGLEIGRWEGGADWASPKAATFLNEKIGGAAAANPK